MRGEESTLDGNEVLPGLLGFLETDMMKPVMPWKKMMNPAQQTVNPQLLQLRLHS